MPFPIDADSPVDENGLILCQDPDLRSRILPLFQYDPAEPQNRPVGYGTAFRIDPWSGCITAFHVIEHLLQLASVVPSRATLPPNVRLAALEVNGIALGVCPLPRDAWRPFAEMFAPIAVDSPPFQEPTLENFCELATVRIPPSSVGRGGTPHLSIDVRRWRPSLGERVMALGFAELDLGAAEDDPISQYLYGSVGIITDIHPADPGRRRPWPLIRIDANWPGGMSGGPVFNEVGHVVGVVSTGFAGEGGAAATYFSGWSVPAQILPTIDPDNPGWFRCIGVFSRHGELVYCGVDERSARIWAEQNGHNDVGLVSHDYASGGWVRAQGQAPRVGT